MLSASITMQQGTCRCGRLGSVSRPAGLLWYGAASRGPADATIAGQGRSRVMPITEAAVPEDVAQEPDDLNSPPRFRKLADRIAIVTGSDSGIGRAVAEAFAMEGADVVVTFLTDESGAQETAR